MTRAQIILVAALAIPLAGCVLSGKPKTPPAKPAAPQPTASTAAAEPLSIPQTVVDLPSPQPFNPAALNTTTPPPEPEPTPEPTAPVTAAKPGGNRAKPPAASKPAAVEPTPAEPPPPETRPPIQEILPADEQSRLRASADSQKTEALKLLSAATHRRLNGNENTMATNIRQWVQQSDQAKAKGDMRSAEEYAHKAYLLAKELQSGK